MSDKTRYRSQLFFSINTRKNQLVSSPSTLLIMQVCLWSPDINFFFVFCVIIIIILIYLVRALSIQLVLSKIWAHKIILVICTLLYTNIRSFNRLFLKKQTTYLKTDNERARLSCWPNTTILSPLFNKTVTYPFKINFPIIFDIMATYNRCWLII